MKREEAEWLHQKFCAGRLLKHVNEPSGIITHAICIHCQINIWQIGDDRQEMLVGEHPHSEEYQDARRKYDPRQYAMPNRSYCTTSGEYDPLLGRCDLCDELSVYASETARLCKSHYERAYRQKIARHREDLPLRCISEEGCQARVQYGTRDFFVVACRRHFKMALTLARGRGQQLGGRW